MPSVASTLEHVRSVDEAYCAALVAAGKAAASPQHAVGVSCGSCAGAVVANPPDGDGVARGASSGVRPQHAVLGRQQQGLGRHHLHPHKLGSPSDMFGHASADMTRSLCASHWTHLGGHVQLYH